MSANTPGPWTFDQPAMGFSMIRSAKGEPIFAVSAPGPKFGDREYSEEEKYANLTLATAAPELLDALKIVASCAGPGSFSFETARKAARAAIAKAEGDPKRRDKVVVQ